MKTIRWTIVTAALLCAPCWTEGKDLKADMPLPVFSIAYSDNIVFEVDPRIELLAGVQSQTGWVEGAGRPGAEPSPYYKELYAFFKPFLNSGAMESARNLMATGFSYDAPCAFALSLEGGSAMTRPEAGWSPYLKGRAWLPSRLDSFARGMAELYADSHFAFFLNSHATDYRSWLTAAAEDADWKRMTAWLRDFYGDRENPVFHFVLAPAMYPGGGYGFSLRNGSGESARLHVYQIVRASQGGGQAIFPSGASLMRLGLHEFGHSFVNPAFGERARDWRLVPIMAPVKKEMAAMAYPSVETFLNELFIRAAVIIATRDLGLASPTGIEYSIQEQARIGFYPIREAIRLLEEYQEKRASYPDFASYAPEILGSLVRNCDELVRRGKPSGYRGLDGEPPADYLAEDFESCAPGTELPRGFKKSVGSMISAAMERPSMVEIVRTDRGEGLGEGQILKLSADDATDSWFFVSRSMAMRKGTVSLRFRAKAEGIRKANGQFGNSYVGFVLTGKDGKKEFKVLGFNGDSAWKEYSIDCEIDPKKLSSIESAVFLNESGTLMVDDIIVEYK